MKRKILLLLGSFIVLYSALMAYRFFFNPETMSTDGIGSIYVRPATSDGGEAGIGEIGEPMLEDRDRVSGRLRGIYRCKSWKKNDVGDYVLDQPRAMLIGKNRKRTFMSADKAVLTVEQIARGIKVKTGVLTGNVKIYYEQEPGSLERPEPASLTKPQRMEQGILEVTLKSVRYDRNALRIFTKDDFAVESNQLEIRGTGLLIQWNEAPRSLRMMEIKKGDVLVLKNLPEKANMFAMSTAAVKPNTSAPAIDSETAGDDKTSASNPITPKIDTTPKDEKVIVEGAVDEGPNIFVAKFTDQVKVISGQQALTGADTLKLFFQWKRGMKLMNSGGNDSAKADKSTAKTASSADKNSTADTSEKIAARDDKTKPKTSELRITWKGPLTIEPTPDRGPAVVIADETKPAKKPRQWFEIDGDGSEVKLVGEQGTLTCKKFHYNNQMQRASFAGTEDLPAVLVMKKGEIIRSNGTVIFDRMKGFGLAKGPGEYYRPDKDDPLSFREKVFWKKHAKIFLGQQVAKNSAGKNKTRFYIKAADCLGDVEISRTRKDKKDPTKILPDDTIHADHLRVTMSDPVDGRASVKKAVASGNVKARQAGMKLSCDKVDVDFLAANASDKTEKSASQAGQKLGLGKVNVDKIFAQGNVIIDYVDPTKPADPATHIKADTVTVRWQNQKIELTGKPARITRGKDYVTSAKIEIDGLTQEVKINQAGEMSYETTQDMSGNELKNPKLFTVKWMKNMNFVGTTGKGVFNGDVDLTLGTEKIEADSLRFALTAPDPAQLEKAKAAGKNQAFSLDIFKGRQFKTVIAKGGKGDAKNVRMISMVADPKNSNWLMRRAQLEGPEINVDVENQIVDIIGPGQVVFEDYRAPVAKAVAKPVNQREGFMTQVGKIDPPSQSVISWKKSAKVNQLAGKITINGDVLAVLNSGNKIVKAKELKTAPLGDLKSGRTTAMRCGTLEIFTQKQASSTSKNNDKLVMGVGGFFDSITKILLTKDVAIEDQAADVTLNAQRVEYTKTSEIIKIWGYLKGAKIRTDAIISYFDKVSGKNAVLESPTLKFNNKTQSAEVEKFNVGGGV